MNIVLNLGKKTRAQIFLLKQADIVYVSIQHTLLQIVINVYFISTLSQNYLCESRKSSNQKKNKKDYLNSNIIQMT